MQLTFKYRSGHDAYFQYIVLKISLDLLCTEKYRNAGRILLGKSRGESS